MSELCPSSVQREHYLALALPAEAAAAFEAHAKTCASCTAEIAQWRSFGAVLREQLEPVRRPATRNEVASLLARADEPTGLRLPGWLMPTVGAAALAVLALIVFRPSAPQVYLPSLVASSELASDSPAGSFETKRAGHAVIALGDDELGLGASTAMNVLRANSNGTTVRLSRGVLAAHVNPARGKRNFDIETPVGRVHVVGTVFRVKVEAEALAVEVIRGVVEVETRAGVKVRVPAGQALRTNGQLAPFEASGFAELSSEPAPAVEPEASVTEVVDAGVAESPDASPAVAKRPVAPVAAWRSAAARGDCESVIQAAEKFLRQDSSDADVWLLLGDCRRRAKRFDQAVAAYAGAAKTREAKGKNGLLQAAELLHEQLHQPAQAIVLIDSYLRSKPERGLEAAALVRKARALMSLGKKREAKTVLADAVKRLPETASAVEANRLLQSL